MCETYGIKFPAEVYGEVQNTDFDELSVDFKVELSQDYEIQLPEVCQVPIDEIYPTVYQEHSTLNVDSTANSIDSFRFFFNYIFLPFDTSEDFSSKNLIPRVKLFFDLKNKQLSKAMSSYIRHIIAEVKQIQFKRDLLNSSIDEFDESVMDEEEKKPKSDSKETVAKLLDLHLRMNKIKQEFEILVNPEMRDAYEFIKFGRRNEDVKETYLLAKSGTITEQMNLLEQLKEKISSHTTVSFALSLTDTIATASSESEIYIPNGIYTFNFLDYLNGNVLICGISKTLFSQLSTDFERQKDENFATITVKEDSSLLFVIDGDMRFENLMIDCRHVKTGFLIKSGKVVLKNCAIIGSSQSSVTEAFSVSGESNLVLIDCTISNFSTGINIVNESKLELIGSKIEKCNIGVSIMGDEVKVSVKSSTISAAEGSIVKYSENSKSSSEKFVSGKSELEK